MQLIIIIGRGSGHRLFMQYNVFSRTEPKLDDILQKVEGSMLVNFKKQNPLHLSMGNFKGRECHKC